MTYIWSTIIVLSIIFTLLTGSVIDLNNVILTTSFDTLKSFGIIASNIILWSGILEVCVDSGMMKYIAYLIKPLIKPLFKTKSEEVLDLISAGFACNIFSLGSAAAPFAIKAMKLLDEENPKKGRESKDMTTLVIINEPA